MLGNLTQMIEDLLAVPHIPKLCDPYAIPTSLTFPSISTILI